MTLTEVLEGGLVAWLEFTDPRVGLPTSALGLVLSCDNEPDEDGNKTNVRFLELRSVGVLTYEHIDKAKITDANTKHAGNYRGLKGLLRFAMWMPGQWKTLPIRDVYDGDNAFLEELIVLAQTGCYHPIVACEAAELIGDAVTANRIGLGQMQSIAKLACVPVMTDEVAMQRSMQWPALALWCWPTRPERHGGTIDYLSPKKIFGVTVQAMEHVVAIGHPEFINPDDARKVLECSDQKLPLRTPSPALHARLEELAGLTSPSSRTPAAST